MKKLRICKIGEQKTSKTGSVYCVMSLQDTQTMEVFSAYVFPEGFQTGGMLGKTFPMELEKLPHPFGQIQYRARIVGPSSEEPLQPPRPAEYPSSAAPSPAGTEDRVRSFALSYAKDVLCAVLSAGGSMDAVNLWQIVGNFEKYLRNGSIPLLEQLRQLQRQEKGRDEKEEPKPDEQPQNDDVPF